jgi:hypothetical protein
VIDGPPKIIALAVDLHENLVDLPAPTAEASSPQPRLADIARTQRADAVPPKPHRLMADVDTALR